MLRQTACCICLLLLPAPAIQAQSSRQSTEWLPAFQTAYTYLKSGQRDQALKEFAALWAANATDAKLATSIGGALDSVSEHALATVWYRRALAIDPHFEPALENLAMNYASLGRLSEAASRLRSILRTHRVNAALAYNLALLDLRLKNYVEAAAVLASVDEQTPGSPPPNLRLARATALFHLRRFGEIPELFVGPETLSSPDAFALLGSAQALIGNLSGAISTLQAGIRKFPSNPALYFRCMLVLLDGGRDDDAKDVLRAATERIPNSALLDYAQALFADKQGRYDDALACAERSLEKEKNNPEVLCLMGSLYDRKGNFSEALRFYAQANQLTSDPYVGARYADLLLRSERSADAEVVLQHLLKSAAPDARVLRVLGKLYRERGELPQAESALRKSIALDPGAPEGHYLLAQLLTRENHRSEAAREFKAYKRSKEESESKRILERIPD
jgi:tetratricopeptide (TPR) repeat protein